MTDRLKTTEARIAELTRILTEAAKPKKVAKKSTKKRAKAADVEKKAVQVRRRAIKAAKGAKKVSRPKKPSGGSSGGANSKWWPFKKRHARGPGPGRDGFGTKSDSKTNKFKCRCTPSGDILMCRCNYKSKDGKNRVKKVRVKKAYKRRYNKVYKPWARQHRKA